jgi:DNA-binding transcriptional regulator of glucitol operon
MNTSDIILGAVMICIGIVLAILQIKRFKNGLKDR